MQTFTEARSTEYVFEPYYSTLFIFFVFYKQKKYKIYFLDQPIYNTGPPPQPWDIVAKPLQLFQPQLTKIEIPNTAQVEVKHLLVLNL